MRVPAHCLERAGITVDTIKLVNHHILAGTESDMGDGGAWAGDSRDVAS